MHKTKHKAFTDYLSFICKTLGIAICVKDVSGFVRTLDPALSLALIPYLLHTNAFCVYMKSDASVCRRCSRSMIPIAKKCRETNAPFAGSCHCGVWEYILPLSSPKGELLGYITAGSFQTQGQGAEAWIRKKCMGTTLLPQTALEKYALLPPVSAFDCKTIGDALGLAADYLAGQVSGSKFVAQPSLPDGLHANEDGMLTRILTLIDLNYKNPIKVSHISEACGCSESYVHHLFKSRTGINFKSYVNWKRIEDAKVELHFSDIPITEIALSVGFSDANYFTKVFASFVGVTPTQYRKQRSFE